MTGRQFEYKIKDYGEVPINEHYTFYRKPLRVVDNRTGEAVRFKSFDEVLDFVLDDGHNVRDIIETWTAMPVWSSLIPFDGGGYDGPTWRIVWYINGEERMVEGYD